jgi:hypothetical protein
MVISCWELELHAQRATLLILHPVLRYEIENWNIFNALCGQG